MRIGDSAIRSAKDAPSFTAMLFQSVKTTVWRLQTTQIPQYHVIDVTEKLEDRSPQGNVAKGIESTVFLNDLIHTPLVQEHDVTLRNFIVVGFTIHRR